MDKYFYVQFKKGLRLFPCLLGTVLLLLFCLVSILGVVTSNADKEASTKFKIAFVGSADDSYLKTGLDVIQAYDSSRFAIETFQMEEANARRALGRGMIDAYVIIPDGYITDAMSGKVGSLQYVSTSGTADLTTLFKDEITAVVSDIIIACEKAMYGVSDLLQENGLHDRTGRFSYDISLTYVEYVLSRADTCSVEVLGIYDSLGAEGYLYVGIIIFLISLTAISTSATYINTDFSAVKLLKSKGVGPVQQIIGEFLIFYLSFIAVFVVIFSLVGTFSNSIPQEARRFTDLLSFKNFTTWLCVLLAISSFSYFLFQINNDIISGVILQFFAAVAFCFISGCFYPLYFFPVVVQKSAAYLPHAIAREALAACLTGAENWVMLLYLVVFGLLFVFLACVCRRLKISK